MNIVCCGVVCEIAFSRGNSFFLLELMKRSEESLNLNLYSTRTCTVFDVKLHSNRSPRVVHVIVSSPAGRLLEWIFLDEAIKVILVRTWRLLSVLNVEYLGCKLPVVIKHAVCIISVCISSAFCHCLITSLLHTEKLQSFNESLPTDALALYPSSAPCPTTDRCPERAYTTMVSDIRDTCPNNDLALRAAGKLRAQNLQK